jgi:predicted DNA-binding transcriptional regulator YafY
MPTFNQNCADSTAHILPAAEFELAAFIHAVQELFSPDEARQSAEDWIEELESANWPSEGTLFDWRCLTIAASVRLATRIDIRLAKTGSNLLSADYLARTVNTSERKINPWQASTQTTTEPF